MTSTTNLFFFKPMIIAIYPISIWLLIIYIILKLNIILNAYSRKNNFQNSLIWF